MEVLVDCELTNAEAADPITTANPTTTISIIEIQNPAIAPSIDMKKFLSINPC